MNHRLDTCAIFAVNDKPNEQKIEKKLLIDHYSK